MASHVGTDRLEAARTIAAMLQRSRDFRDSVAAHPCGERPIVVASIDDRMQEVVARITEIGLPVTLWVHAGSTSMTVATVREAEAHEHTPDECPVHPDSNVGMFISYLWQRGTVVFHVAESPAELELEFA